MRATALLLAAALVGAAVLAAAPAASAASVCVAHVVGDCPAVACLDHKDGRGWDVCVLQVYCPMGHDVGCPPPFDP